ncbi:MAG TPA: hypothetical protein VKF38_07645 [Anaerolineaceae bacterium]|nr:hypothetical protein [Anaerolineaceae bacterium]
MLVVLGSAVGLLGTGVLVMNAVGFCVALAPQVGMAVGVTPTNTSPLFKLVCKYRLIIVSSTTPAVDKVKGDTPTALAVNFSTTVAQLSPFNKMGLQQDFVSVQFRRTRLLDRVCAGDLDIMWQDRSADLAGLVVVKAHLRLVIIGFIPYLTCNCIRKVWMRGISVSQDLISFN